VTNRVELAVWWVVGTLGIAAVIYAGVLGWAVLHTMNWDLLFGNTDWNPGNLTTAPPAPPPPAIPGLPGGAGLPGGGGLPPGPPPVPGPPG
jgi:hypothetical protein